MCPGRSYQTSDKHRPRFHWWLRKAFEVAGVGKELVRPDKGRKYEQGRPDAWKVLCKSLRKAGALEEE
jgi:hypothetical protein